jgi:2-dehydropantoate 2-reductase
MAKKIAVLGTGANGAAIGADLTRAGLDVVLIDQWPENVAALRERGARIEMPRGSDRAGAGVQPLRRLHLHRYRFDIVLMLVKAYDFRWAAQLIEPYLKSDGLLVGVQNGMTTQTIAEVVGPSRSLGCVIEISSSMFVPALRSATPTTRVPGSPSARTSRRKLAGRKRSPNFCAMQAESRSLKTSKRPSG